MTWWLRLQQDLVSGTSFIGLEVRASKFKGTSSTRVAPCGTPLTKRCPRVSYSSKESAFETRMHRPHWWQTLHQLPLPIWKKENYFSDTWHDTWHMKHDMWEEVNLLSKFHLPCSYCLGVTGDMWVIPCAKSEKNMTDFFLVFDIKSQKYLVF